jgi:microcystin-dependent protein
MSEPFIGEIRMVGFNFAPRGWATCDGQLLPINQNTALFSLLGTFYGGDGRTTFGLPDLRGRVAVHRGTGPGLSSYQIGGKGGVETQALTIGNLPAHDHDIRGSSGAQTTNRTTGAYQADGNSYSTSEDTTMGATASAGSGLAFDNRQPYLVTNYVIALQGVFPSRN